MPCLCVPLGGKPHVLYQTLLLGPQGGRTHTSQSAVEPHVLFHGQPVAGVWGWDGGCGVGWGCVTDTSQLMPGPSHRALQAPPTASSRPAGLTCRTARCTVDRCPGWVGWLPCWSAHHSPVWRLSHHWVGKDHSRWTCGFRDLSEVALHGRTERSPTLTGWLLNAMPKKMGACVPFFYKRGMELEEPKSSVYCVSEPDPALASAAPLGTPAPMIAPLDRWGLREEA